jgi:hypothetical protein
LPELLRPAFDYPGGGGGGGGGWQNVHSLRIGPRRNCSRYDSYKVGQEEAALWLFVKMVREAELVKTNTVSWFSMCRSLPAQASSR